MSRTKIVALMLAAFASSANAVTINELSDKSRQLLQLTTDAEIAKKSNDLQQLGVANGTVAKTADEFSVIALHGDPLNPIADIYFNGVKYERKRGEVAVLGYTVESIANGEVKFCKQAKGSRSCTTRYLSVAPDDARPIGRDLRSVASTPAPAFAPPAGMPLNAPNANYGQGK